MPANPDRRQFLSTLGSWGAAVALARLQARTARAEPSRTLGYGPLRPARDETTGWELLRLPPGFTYKSFGWVGDPLECGTATPGVHDGMAALPYGKDRIVLVRNHEVNGDAESFGKPHLTYDPRGPAGCTSLEFNTATGEFKKAWCSLAGTSRNCAGGVTPWGTWLTCEETHLGPGDVFYDHKHDFKKTHGWIFEVHPDGAESTEPLRDMGRFWHEAVAIDPHTGIVYETEDRQQAGFFRFIPNTPGKLQKGGRLEMMKIVGELDLRKGVDARRTFDVQWVPIDDPQKVAGANTDDQGVFHQGKAQGATTFARLEGCWYSDKDQKVYFDATSGGEHEKGQIWAYDPAEQQLKLVYESPGANILDMADNLCVSPQGSMVLCEDGGEHPHRIHGLTLNGQLFPFAENNIDFRQGARPQHIEAADYRNEEWAGTTFSPDGKWLFANIQSPASRLPSRAPGTQVSFSSGRHFTLP